MRKSNKTNTLVIISNHVKSIYNDRWIGDILHYTGMGMEGNQSLNFAQNKTLVNSTTNGIDKHLFEAFKDKQYIYIGRVVLAGSPYQEEQLDRKGNKRLVWMFPLRVVDSQIPALPAEEIQELEKIKQKQAKRLSDEELRKRVLLSSKRAGRRKIITSKYERNIWVSEFVKRIANGKCQLCKKEAPFKNQNDEPYLETHHIIWLSEGGEAVSYTHLTLPTN